MTRAQCYAGLFIDGRLAGVSGFFGSEWCLGKRAGPFEVFGFSVHVTTYPRLNKLHMMCLTSRTFHDYWVNLYPTVIWPATHFYTTCIAQRHEQKGNRGVLKLAGRERLPDGLFRLSYEQRFRPWDAQHALEIFLEKEHYDPATGEKIPEE